MFVILKTWSHILFLSLILAGCSHTSNNSAKLLANIETRLKKEKGIEHGATLAIYDLAGLGSQRCLHAKDYGVIVNDSIHNAQFISKVLSKYNKGALQRRAKAKLMSLRSNLARLHEKYMILNNSDVRKLNLKEYEEDTEDSIFDNIEDNTRRKSANYLKELYEIDKIARHIPIFFPIYSAKLTSHFGMRKHPIKRLKKFHYGTDFAGLKGSQIYAAAYGKVVSVERVNGYGNTVVIDHGKGLQTRYAHLSKVLVNIGEDVIRGQKVGLQGKTGTATSEHLHLEVLFKSRHLNPIDFVDNGHSCLRH